MAYRDHLISRAPDGVRPMRPALSGIGPAGKSPRDLLAERYERERRQRRANVRRMAWALEGHGCNDAAMLAGALP